MKSVNIYLTWKGCQEIFHWTKVVLQHSLWPLCVWGYVCVLNVWMCLCVCLHIHRKTGECSLLSSVWFLCPLASCHSNKHLGQSAFKEDLFQPTLCRASSPWLVASVTFGCAVRQHTMARSCERGKSEIRVSPFSQGQAASDWVLAKPTASRLYPVPRAPWMPGSNPATCGSLQEYKIQTTIIFFYIYYYYQTIDFDNNCNLIFKLEILKVFFKLYIKTSVIGNREMNEET